MGLVPHNQTYQESNLSFSVPAICRVSMSLPRRLQTLTRQQDNRLMIPQGCGIYQVRKPRLTASRFGEVVKRRDTTPVARFVRSLLYDRVRETKPMRYGRDNEPVAREAYKATMQRNGHPHLQTLQSGFVVDLANSWLGCSPDNIVCETLTPNVHLGWQNTNARQVLKKWLQLKSQSTSTISACTKCLAHRLLWERTTTTTIRFRVKWQ